MASTTSQRLSSEPRPADVLVVFGITGDLAKVMTFRSLYRLEMRKLLDCPILGVAVDDWTVDKLREHARDCIEGTGEVLDKEVFDRFAERLSYVQGDFSDAATYGRVADAIKGKGSPVFYLEIPPFLFGTVVKGLSDTGLTKTARVVVEKPFGHDLKSAGELAAELHQYIDESRRATPDRPLPGEDGPGQDRSPPIHECDARARLEPELHRVRADNDGGELRGSRSRWALLRSGRCLARCGRQPSDAGGGGVRHGGAIPWRPANDQGVQVALFRAVAEADPAHYVRGQYDGYLKTDGVAPDSTTETYAALRLDIENWRWAGVPFFIPYGEAPRVHADRAAVGVQACAPAGLQPVGSRRRAEPGRREAGPDDRHQAGGRSAPRGRAGREPITLDMEFSSQGGEGPTPYEVLLHAAMVGDSTRFTRQDAVEETWRVMQPLVDAPPPVHPYAQGSWGPDAADELVAGHGRWHEPWVTS